MECDSGDRGSPSLKLSLELKTEIIFHFRVLQRCRRMEDWDEAVKTFFAHVEHAVRHQRMTGKGAREDSQARQQRHDAQLAFLRAYFQVNWFVDRWIRELAPAYLRNRA